MSHNDIFGGAAATKSLICISNQALFSRDSASAWIETVAQLFVSSASSPAKSSSKNNSNNDDDGGDDNNTTTNNATSAQTPRDRFLASKPMILAILKVFAVSEGRQLSNKQIQEKQAQEEEKKKRQERARKANEEVDATYQAVVAAAGGFGKPDDAAAVAQQSKPVGATGIDDFDFSSSSSSASAASSSRSANLTRMMLDVRAAYESIIRKQGPEAFDPKTLGAEAKRERDREMQEKKIKDDRAQMATMKAKYDRSELTSDEREIFERRMQEREIAKQQRIEQGLEPEEDDDNDES